MRKNLSILLILGLVVSAVWLARPVAAQPATIGIDATEGRVKDIISEYAPNLTDLVEHLEGKGYTVVVLEEISDATLAGLDVLVIGKLRDDEVSPFSAGEVTAITAWFDLGAKFLVVGADSDYTEPYLNPEDTSFKADEPNRILHAIGSHLALETAALEDPTTNAGAGYRVVSHEACVNEFSNEINAGVNHVLFHGPTFVVGYMEGAYVPFGDVASETCMCLWLSSSEGTVLSADGVDPLVHAVGEMGQFVEAAAERIETSGDYYSKVLVQGESWLGDRNTMNIEYYEWDFEGPTYINNALDWGLTLVEMPTNWVPIIVIIGIVLIIIAIIFIFLRR